MDSLRESSGTLSKNLDYSDALTGGSRPHAEGRRYWTMVSIYLGSADAANRVHFLTRCRANPVTLISAKPDSIVEASTRPRSRLDRYEARPPSPQRRIRRRNSRSYEQEFSSLLNLARLCLDQD